MYCTNINPEDVAVLRAVEADLFNRRPSDIVPVRAGLLATLTEMLTILDEAWEAQRKEIEYLQEEVLRLECVVDELE